MSENPNVTNSPQPPESANRISLAANARVLISACLLGEHCRYDGAIKPNAVVQGLAQDWRRDGITVIPVCPEVLGGLPIPRPGAQLCGGDGHDVLAGRARVMTSAPARDCTREFCDGARQALARAAPLNLAILKARSPSCGRGQTEIDGALSAGDGVLAALLRQAGVQCCTDEELTSADVLITFSADF
jgi:uncharacterized protein YbbK (DUF523 family)